MSGHTSFTESSPSRPRNDTFSSGGRRFGCNPSVAGHSAEPSLLEKYGRLPVAFEPNRGQADGRTRFLARGAGYSILVRPSGVELRLRGADAVRLELAGGNGRAALTASRRLTGKVNYLLGNDRSRWLTELPTYARITAPQVYPGIDLSYYGRGGALEYDFVVHPGADAARIGLGLRVARSFRLERSGNLALELASGTLRQLAPRAYQRIDGVRRAVKSRFVLRGNHVGFAVGRYDRSRTLVIDPSLAYSTYLGGSGGEAGFGIAVDSAGSAYVTGDTASSNFPTSAGAYQTAMTGFGTDVFVTKAERDPGARSSIPPTWAAPALRPATRSPSTPQGPPTCTPPTWAETTTTPAPGSPSRVAPPTWPARRTPRTSRRRGPYQPAPGPGGPNDAFVTKLNADGSALDYSTYLGGSDNDYATGIAVVSGLVHVAGTTSSTDFPAVSALDGTKSGTSDAFVTKLDAAGIAPLYSTYLGGSDMESGYAIAADSSGNAYVTGQTGSTNFPTTVSPYQTMMAGLADAFVTKLNSGESALTYSTYLGGTGLDAAAGIAFDSAGTAYVIGSTLSTDFPTKNPHQAASGGGNDAFVAMLSPGGDTLTYSTYLGGGSSDYGNGIAVASVGHAYVTGQTESGDFPTEAAFQGTSGGSPDAFVAKVGPGMPTAAVLHSLVAVRSGGGVLLRWRTASEVGLLGFDVFREQAGRRVRLNAKLIRAAGGARGRAYVFRDREGGRRYLLHEVRLDGSRVWSARVGVG